MLNSLHKSDYVKQILKEDDQGMEYLKQVDKKVLEKNNEISELIWEITDLQDTWDTAIDDINKVIKERAIKNGISKEHHKKFKFKEFNIKDMYYAKNGTVCFHCSKGLECKRHGLKEGVLKKNESDFERA
jgi:hypothetical protein